MNFGQAITSGFRNYATFSGRAARSEYFYWALFEVLVSVVAAILDIAIFPDSPFGPLYTISGIVLFLPGLAVAVRRLHDIDRTGWWLLLVLTAIGALLLIVWAFFKGTDGPNRYGADPLKS